jgi:predicted Zn-dependent protease
MFRILKSNPPFSAPRDNTARASCRSRAKRDFLSFLLLEIDQLVAQQQFNQASLLFKEIFDQHPGDPTSLRKLAALLYQLGQHEAAITMLADALDPEDPDLESVLALAGFLQASDRISEAADLLYATAPGLAETAIELLRLDNRQDEANEVQGLLVNPPGPRAA